MTAKEYLQQLYVLRKNIDFNISEVKQLNSIIYSVQAVQTDSERVQSSVKNFDKIGDSVAKVADLKKTINSEVDKYADLEKDIRHIINCVSDTSEREILRYRYILFMSWKDIATVTNYSVRHILRTHKSALLSVEKIKGELLLP